MSIHNLKSNNIKIYVCTFKDYDNILDDDLYAPIVGGADINSVSNEYQLDNDGNNISFKNPYYNEFTALYWIWKNSKYDYVGLIPYRRHFTKHFFSKKELQYKDIKEYLKNNDIIVPKKIGFKEGSVKNYHENTKNVNMAFDNFELLKDTIHNFFPKYDNAFKVYLANNKFYPYNMFISSKKTIDEFCDFVFTILFNIEDKLGLTPYGEDFNKQRIFALLGEILFGVWLTGSDLKIKECYICREESKNFILSTLDENFLNRNLGYYFNKIKK